MSEQLPPDLPTDLPPMDGSLARLLNSELQRPDPNTTERAGVSQRLQAALPQLGWTATAALSSHAASHAAGSATAAAATGARVSLPLARVILISALSAGGGAAGGAALHARFAQPANAAPPTVPPALIVAAPPVIAPDALADTPPPAPTPLPAKRAASHPPSPTLEDSDVELRREQALVDRARAAVARRDAAEALSAIDAHAARYPKGRLSEERDALRVQALALTGPAAPVRAAAADFQRRYPQSLLWPSLRRTLEQLH